jgi:hypothetical protein
MNDREANFIFFELSENGLFRMPVIEWWIYEYTLEDALYRNLSFHSSLVWRNYSSKNHGESVRCVIN